MHDSPLGTCGESPIVGEGGADGQRGQEAHRRQRHGKYGARCVPVREGGREGVAKWRYRVGPDTICFLLSVIGLFRKTNHISLGVACISRPLASRSDLLVDSIASRRTLADSPTQAGAAARGQSMDRLCATSTARHQALKRTERSRQPPALATSRPDG